MHFKALCKRLGETAQEMSMVFHSGPLDDELTDQRASGHRFVVNTHEAVVPLRVGRNRLSVEEPVDAIRCGGSPGGVTHQPDVIIDAHDRIARQVQLRLVLYWIWNKRVPFIAQSWLLFRHTTSQLLHNIKNVVLRLWLWLWETVPHCCQHKNQSMDA